jgi:hypothetical protein
MIEAGGVDNGVIEIGVLKDAVSIDLVPRKNKKDLADDCQLFVQAR